MLSTIFVGKKKHVFFNVTGVEPMTINIKVVIKGQCQITHIAFLCHDQEMVERLKIGNMIDIWYSMSENWKMHIGYGYYKDATMVLIFNYFKMENCIVVPWWKHIRVEHNGQLKVHFESSYLTYFEPNEIALQIKTFKWSWIKIFYA